MKMPFTCPNCTKDIEIDWNTLQSELELASDGSFISAHLPCPECEKDIEFWYSLSDLGAED